MPEMIKPSLHFTIICDDVRQETGGKISLMGLFENIYAVKFPAVHPRLAVVTEWTDGQGEFGTTLRILSPDRKTVLRETSSRIEMRGRNFKHRDISLHLNVEFKSPGTYWIENFLDGEMVHSIPLNIAQVKEQVPH